MASANLSYSGHTGVINAQAAVTELTTSGNSRYVKLRLYVWTVDTALERDASYSVYCAQSGTDVEKPMYSGFTISGSKQEIFRESFYVTVPAGTSTAEIAFSFTVRLYSPSAGAYRSISGTITTLYLTEEAQEEPETVTPSSVVLSASYVSMGDTLHISISRASTQCWHRLYYKAGNGSKKLFADNVGTYCQWKIPDLTASFTDSTSIQLTIYCATYTGTASYQGQKSASCQLDLPGETQPECAESAEMGSSLSITLPRKSSSYTHTLSYQLAGKTGEIASAAGESCTWAVPLALAKQIPAKTSAYCTITCATRLNSLVIGEETLRVLLTVPDNELTKPAGSMSLSPSGDLQDQFSGMYIRTRTGVKAEFTASSDYSEISCCRLTVDGIQVEGNPAVSAPLSTYGNVTVTGEIVDARGYIRKLIQTIPVVYYDRPRVLPYSGESTIVAARCQADGTRNPSGQHLLLRAGRKFTPLGSGDGQLNFCRLQYRYKEAGAESYSDFEILIPESDVSTEDIQLVALDAVAQLKTGYTVQIEAIDTLGGYSVITIPVAALTIPFHIGAGSGNVAVGKYCDYSRENAFEIGLTTYLDTGIALRTIFPEGTWSQGMELGSSVVQADTGAVQLYTLFLAVCEDMPVLLVKLGSGIWGSGIQITCDGSVITLDTAPAPVTALYALL